LNRGTNGAGKSRNLFQIYLKQILTISIISPPLISAAPTYDPDVLPKGREYFELRDGLANCRMKFEREKTGRIAFLGGSITR